MGRATVIEHLGEGLYEIALDFGSERKEAMIQKINDELQRSREELEEAEIDLEAAQDAVDEQTVAVDQAIIDYRRSITAGEPLNTKPILDAATKLLELSGERDKLAFKVADLKSQIESLKQDLKQAQAIDAEDQRQAWCADFTTDAEGDVATLEIPGEPQNILIAPEAKAPTHADGRVLARGVMSPSQAYFNAAVLPGWQRHKPTFRAGTIVLLDGDHCDVELTDATSSAQDLPVNIQNLLSGVPIEYMSCNGGAFEEGDEVVVDMRGEEPKVIGFVKEPRGCCFWPPGPGLPEIGEPFVVTEDGFVPGSSTQRLYIEDKGAAEYRRDWPDGYPMPDRWSYDDAFHYSVFYDSSAADGRQVNSVMRQLSVPGWPEFESPTVRCNMRINIDGGGEGAITIQGAVTFHEVDGNGRASIRTGPPGGAGVVPDDTGAEFVEFESSDLNVFVAPTTEEVLWRPVVGVFQVNVSAFSDSPDIDLAVWCKCLRVS